MRIIGLTGSIACGKSTVSAFLASKGIPVVDGDQISRDLTVPGSPVLQAIRQSFGNDYIYDDGTLNRRRLGRLVFSDPQARHALDDLMSPFLLSATRQQIEQFREAGSDLCILDMPLLFEKGYDRLCDSVWTVWLPENVQLSRLMNRDGYTYDEAMNRIRSVLSSDEKAARADHVIDNSGTPENTYRIVSDLLNEELRAAAAQSLHRRFRGASQGPETSPSDQAAPDPVFSSSVPAPVHMERPSASRSLKAGRKAAWRMPVWLKTVLISLSIILLIGAAAVILMNGYLQRCSETHQAEQAAVDRNYPLLYRELIEKYSAEYNLSPAYVASIIRNESSFQPKAESGAGARGLMQLMPDTAEWIAHKLKVNGFAFERMYDPESNIRFGCWYLNYLSRLFAGDPVAVTAAYHAGQGQVKVWLSDPLLSEDGYSLSFESLPDGPTKNYTGRVTRDYGIYQKKYFSPDLSSDLSGASSSGYRAFIVYSRKQYSHCRPILQNIAHPSF